MGASHFLTRRLRTVKAEIALIGICGLMAACAGVSAQHKPMAARQ